MTREKKPKPERAKKERKERKPRGRRLRLARDRRVEAVGIALIAFGFLCTALVWTGVRESNNVAFQLPIIASGGLVAVGCYIVGGLLLVGGLVMTRFARLEKARAPRHITVVPDGTPGEEHEVSLEDEPAEQRGRIRARRLRAKASSSEN